MPAAARTPFGSWRAMSHPAPANGPRAWPRFRILPLVKRLVPILALLYATAALCAPAGWAPLRASSDASYFIGAPADPAGQSTVTLSVLASFSATQTASFNQSLTYRSTVTRYRIDCSGNRYTALGVAYYVQDMAHGKPVRRYTFDHTESQNIIPWSRLDEARGRVCRASAGQPESLDGLTPTTQTDTRHSVFSNDAGKSSAAR